MQDKYWHGRPTFVTGASGLMGGWLVKALLDRGADVIVLRRDRVPTSMKVVDGFERRVTTVSGSIEDFALLRRSFAEYSIDTVFHLAGQPLVGVAKKRPIDTLEINIRGTWNVLEAARVAGVGGVVVASSDKAYGSSDRLPYVESHPLQGRYPYDVSKSCADLISQMYAATYRLPVCIARCANLFGGGDLNFNRVIPGVIQATLRGERFLIRSDGNFVRDFVYVEDAAEAYVLMAEELRNRPELAGQAFNVGLEVQLSVLELVHTVLRLMGRTDLKPTILNEASSETRQQYMLSSKIRKVLRWEPKYDMEAGLLKTVEWYQEYFDSIAPFPAGVASAAASAS